MGLDMTMIKKHYVKNWKHSEEKYTCLIKKSGEVVDYINTERIIHIVEEVIYWRKANAIHKWFQNNTDFETNGEEVSVSREQMNDLLEVCNKVIAGSQLISGKISNGQELKNGVWEDIKEDGKYIKDPTVAKELLPTEAGFFFGGLDYDEWYLRDVVDTQQMLKAELALNNDGADYYYSANW